MWSTYAPLPAAMRARALASISSLSPKSSASAGQACTQAGIECPATERSCSSAESCTPLRSVGAWKGKRSLHSVHLLTLGASELQSEEIAPNGQASMQ
jgi:hypothetical protein